MTYQAYLQHYKHSKINGRYLTLAHLESFFNQLPASFKKDDIGKSVIGVSIPMFSYGEGFIRVLIWSQMHGNETTTTKGLIDFMKKLSLTHDFKSQFKIKIIPILNPDGATAYTRVNANLKDLNRDFVDFLEPESRILQAVYDDFKPHYCLNLHDQRTIFSVGDTSLPATMSFLAPAYNITKDYNEVRRKTASLISNLAQELQSYIPNQVGRFDDTYNPNCVGDHFMSLGTPTFLFEAGHYQFDYQREYTRFCVFVSLNKLFTVLNENDIVIKDLSNYLTICQNKKRFCDVIFKNIAFYYDNIKKISNFAIQYEEVLENHQIVFKPQLIEKDKIETPFAHLSVDFMGKTLETNMFKALNLNGLVNFDWVHFLKKCNY